MVVSLPQKKGPCRRQNQAGQGHEVDGTGRRSRSSAGRSAGKCLSGRSYACGSHARRSPCPTPARTAPAKARARDRRPRLRLRPAPRATEKAWYRTARALPEEQPASEIRRWPQAAPLSATLDRGANQCLARSIPQIVGPTRTSALHLSRLLLPCLLLDYAEVLFMKHALRQCLLFLQAVERVLAIWSPPVRFPLSSAHQSPTNGEHHASEFDRRKQEAS